MFPDIERSPDQMGSALEYARQAAGGHCHAAPGEAPDGGSLNGGAVDSGTG